MKPKLLDLFSCAGGAGTGYSRAGFDVYAVDIEPQPNNPFFFLQADAIKAMETLLDGRSLTFSHPDGRNATLLLDDFAALHGSPPCQTFTAYGRSDTKGWRGNYSDFLPQTRAAFQGSGLPYVIENVAGAPLDNPVQLCGSSFGLDIRRHRLFESNVPLLAPACDHSWQKPRFAPASNRKNLRSTVEVGVWRIPLKVQQAAMGIDWMTLRELSEALPPAYTEFIGSQLLNQVELAA